jgi:hypothetical protein
MGGYMYRQYAQETPEPEPEPETGERASAGQEHQMVQRQTAWHSVSGGDHHPVYYYYYYYYYTVSFPYLILSFEFYPVRPCFSSLPRPVLLYLCPSKKFQNTAI